MIRKLLFITDIPRSLLITYISHLKERRIDVTFSPKEYPEITFENQCIFAFMQRPPPEAIAFLEKNAGKSHLFFFFSATDQARSDLHKETLHKLHLPIWKTNDQTFEMVMSVYEHLSVLMEKALERRSSVSKDQQQYRLRN